MTLILLFTPQAEQAQMVGAIQEKGTVADYPSLLRTYRVEC